MKILKITVAVLALLVALGLGFRAYVVWYANPRTERELLENPDGERAARVMLLTLPSGRRLPINYLREGDLVYAGADGPWWKELRGAGFPVTLWIRGETLRGSARAVLDDSERTADVFSRLRPDAVEGFGTLVEIRLARPERP